MPQKKKNIWVEKFDETYKRPFWYNRKTKESSWTRPSEPSQVDNTGLELPEGKVSSSKEKIPAYHEKKDETVILSENVERKVNHSQKSAQSSLSRLDSSDCGSPLTSFPQIGDEAKRLSIGMNKKKDELEEGSRSPSNSSPKPPKSPSRKRSAAGSSKVILEQTRLASSFNTDRDRGFKDGGLYGKQKLVSMQRSSAEDVKSSNGYEKRRHYSSKVPSNESLLEPTSPVELPADRLPVGAVVVSVAESDATDLTVRKQGRPSSLGRNSAFSSILNPSGHKKPPVILTSRPAFSSLHQRRMGSRSPQSTSPNSIIEDSHVSKSEPSQSHNAGEERLYEQADASQPVDKEAEDASLSTALQEELLVPESNQKFELPGEIRANELVEEQQNTYFTMSEEKLSEVLLPENNEGNVTDDAASTNLANIVEMSNVEDKDIDIYDESVEPPLIVEEDNVGGRFREDSVDEILVRQRIIKERLDALSKRSKPEFNARFTARSSLRRTSSTHSLQDAIETTDKPDTQLLTIQERRKSLGRTSSMLFSSEALQNVTLHHQQEASETPTSTKEIESGAHGVKRPLSLLKGGSGSVKDMIAKLSMTNADSIPIKFGFQLPVSHSKNPLPVNIDDEYSADSDEASARSLSKVTSNTTAVYSEQKLAHDEGAIVNDAHLFRAVIPSGSRRTPARRASEFSPGYL